MTPLTIVIDRSFRGVGRVCQASGTTNPTLVRKYHRMLGAFKDDGRVDLLRAIRDHVLTFADAYDAYRRGALHELATADTAKRLTEAYDKWRERADVSDKTKESRVTSGRYLAKSARARVADLPRLLRSLRDSLGAKHPRSFNLLRSNVTAFLRDTLTRAHPLYATCTAIEPAKVQRTRKGRPFAPDQLTNFFPNRETDPIDGIAWGMAVTGMGIAEYWGRWYCTADRVHIEGTKRDQRVRDVPLTWHPVTPMVHRQTFANKVRQRTGHAFQPYDLRRTFAHALEESGISRTRRRLYLGHGTASSTDLYEHHELKRFLASDAERLCEYFGLTPVKSPVIGLVKSESA